MRELDHKEGWVPKNGCFQIVVLKKTLVSPLDSKEIKPLNPKWNQPWIFIGRADAEAETPVLCPPDFSGSTEKSWCWEKLRAGEESNREWDGWMVSPTPWTWIWTNSRKQWRTGKPDMLQPMGSQSWMWLSDWTKTTKFWHQTMHLCMEQLNSENGCKPFNDCQTHRCLPLSSYPVCKDKDTMWVGI